MPAPPPLARRGRQLAVGLLFFVAACAPDRPRPSGSAPAAEVTRAETPLPNGSVALVTPRGGFHVGGQAALTLEVRCRSGTIAGPIEGEILIASISGGNVHVRTLAVAPVTVAAGRQAAVDLVWDEKDDAGRDVADDDFTLRLTFETSTPSAARQLSTVHYTVTVSP